MTFISHLGKWRVALEQIHTRSAARRFPSLGSVKETRLTCNLSHSAEHVQALRVQGSNTVIHVPEFKHTHDGNKQEIECYLPACS